MGEGREVYVGMCVKIEFISLTEYVAQHCFRMNDLKSKYWYQYNKLKSTTLLQCRKKTLGLLI